MQIGDLAERAGVSTRTIRYYEELGLVEPMERTHGGFRLYCEDQLRRLQIIQGLKCLGFDLEQVRHLFSLRDRAETGGDLARQMIDNLQTQQNEIDAKIAQYEELKERNRRGIDILGGCLCCRIKVFERDCHGCETYKSHDEVPYLVECAIFAR
jgi:MerR family Zn(II)-responsive transcriptional regulator of zntA